MTSLRDFDFSVLPAMSARQLQNRVGGWVRASRSFLAVVGAGLLASCSGSLEEGSCFECAIADQRFYASTWLIANPSSVTVEPGVDASAKVSVGSDGQLAFNLDAGVRTLNGVTIVPPTPGVTLSPSDEPCDLPSLGVIGEPVCRTYRLAVSATAIAAGTRTVTLSAVWEVGDGGSTTDPGRAIERLEQFSISLPAAPPPPDFQFAVAQTGTFHATRITLPVAITRTGGFAEPVTLAFDGLGSGIEGSFVADPASADRSNLVLVVPARYAGGGLAPLRVTATAAGGLVRVRDFTQRIDSLFALAVVPNAVVLDPSAPPVDVVVRLDFGPLAATDIGRIELTVPNPPPGVSAQFLPDTPLVASGPLPYVLGRTLRLTSTDGRAGAGTVQIRATAIDVSPDTAVPPQLPFFETTLALRVAASLQWSYVGQGLSHELTTTDAIGAALQGNNHPAVAWLEGRPGLRKVFLRRFDGATFNASPSGVVGLVAPLDDIVEASFALASADVAKVAFTYGGGASIAVGSASPSAPAWSIGAPIGSGAGLRRSPRLVSGAGDALTLAYVLRANAPSTASDLFVRRSLAGGSFDPLPGPQATGSINQDEEGRVLEGTPALALRADGTPVIAWIEQPGDPGSPPVLWLRAHSGAAWLGSLRVQQPGRPLLVPSSVQVAVERTGTVVVSWLEGSPARLMVARVDMASQVVTVLSHPGSSDGALNIAESQPARDVTLGLDGSGRIVVAWTEGGLKPELWAKRLNADGTWSLLGSSIDTQGRALKSPRFVSDSNSRLYIAYTTYYSGADLGSTTYDSDISVVRWTP